MPIIKARSSSITNNIDLRGVPTASTPSASTNTTQLATTAFVKTNITNLIDSAPEALDTLNELALAINNDESFASTVTTALAGKVAKAGDTMTGFLTLHANPSSNMHAATKSYVDQEITNQMIYSTDDVAEGVTNLYYTDTRARDAISLDTDNSSVLDYNSVTGQFTYNHPSSDGILEGSTNLYYTNTRVRNAISLSADDNTIISYSSSTGQFTFTTPDTDQIDEGSTNLYFTTSRARQSISAGSNISYDSSTGIISTTAAVSSVNGQTGAVVLDTDDVSEGSTNLYYTNTRARGAVSLTTDDSSILDYNNGTGEFTFTTPDSDKIDEGSSNLYYTNTRARNAISVSGWDNLDYNSATGVISITAPSTDDVTEGSNLYYTDARARAALSATKDSGDGNLTYDNTTGEFTYTGPDDADYRVAVSADRKSTRLNSSHMSESRMPSSA